MKPLLAIAAFTIVTVPAFAQQSTTGVSAPPPAMIDANQDEVQMQAPVVRKPSADVAYAPGSPQLPANAVTSAPPVAARGYGTYVPYTPAGVGGESRIVTPRDPDAEIVTEVPGRREFPADAGPRPINGMTGQVIGAPGNQTLDEDAGIVTHVASRENEVPQGTLLATQIRETVSTANTEVGTSFSAEVTSPMERDGRVIIPVGSVVHGRITEVRGGRRISGAAAIHLKTESVTLPDGTHYILHAQVVDTSEHNVVRVNDEGTILRRDHVKGTLAAMSLTTGGAAAAGAMLGGIPGAFIGAGIGAGVSTAWWLKQDRQEVVPANTGVIFSLSVPMIITPLAMGTE